MIAVLVPYFYPDDVIWIICVLDKMCANPYMRPTPGSPVLEKEPHSTSTLWCFSCTRRVLAPWMAGTPLLFSLSIYTGRFFGCLKACGLKGM